jgi:hypothetical protein
MSRLKTTDRFWTTGIITIGGTLALIGLVGIFIKDYLQTLLTDYLMSSGFFSVTSLQTMSSLPVDIFILGVALILVLLGRKLLLYWEDPLTRINLKLCKSNTANWLIDHYLLLSFSFLFFIVILLYHNSLDIFFVFDDFNHLMLIQVESWYLLFKPNQFFWRPMAMLLYRWAYNSFGLDPFGYHLIFIAIHIINTILVYLITQKLFNRKNLSLLTSTIFATRFSHLFAVSLTNTQDPIMALFIFLTVLFYLKALRKKKFFYVSLICFILSLMFKEPAIVLPLLLLAYELAMKPQSQDLRAMVSRIIKRQYSYYLVMLGYLGLRFLKSSLIQNSLGTHDINENLYAIELGKNTISSLINYPRFSFNGPLDPCTIMVVILVGFAFFKIKNKLPLFKDVEREELRGVVFGILWYFIALSPVLLIWHVAKHYNYLPVFGFSLVMSCLAYHLFKKIHIDHPALGNTFIVLFISISVLYSYSKINKRLVEREGYYKCGTASQNLINEIKQAYPQLPKGAKLYFVPKGNLDFDLMKDFHNRVSPNGNLFRLFYFDKTIQTYFITKPELDELQPDKKTFVFAFDLMHLYDLTPSLSTN